MMLPEHVKILRELVKEDQYEQKLSIDEQQLEAMNEIVAEALALERFVEVTYYHQHNYEMVAGKVYDWDELSQNLHIIDRLEQKHCIPTAEIANIRLMEEME